MQTEEIGVIDMFCGVGGLTHGFVLEGYDVLAGIDLDESCSYAYEKNNNAKFLKRDVRKLKPEEIEKIFSSKKIKVLVGCAPCQPFSRYSVKPSKRNDDWNLVKSFAKIIEQTNPEIVSMENVPQLKNHKVFKEFQNKLKKTGYKISWQIVYGPDYGLPQERERLILLASKLGEINLIEKTHSPENYRTVKDTIGNLPPIDAGQSHPKDPIHLSSKLSEINLERIKASKPGKTWKDWSKNLQLACHKKDTGKGYISVYGRMEWNKPSPTITTQFFGYGNGRFGHPKQNRAISLREGALLQTFPETYEFSNDKDTIKIKTIGKHIGNAVPVVLGQVIAKSISKHLEGLHG
ncbi:MAG: DNA cytosine methyltransferase [Anaerolineales bacterium]|nr:DNA cytosine methyltransferase [Anaerolineales bacterium]